MAKASPPRGMASDELVTVVSEVDMMNYWMLWRSGYRPAGIQRNRMPLPPPFFAQVFILNVLRLCCLRLLIVRDWRPKFARVFILQGPMQKRDLASV